MADDEREKEARRVYDNLAEGHLPVSQHAVDKLLLALAHLRKDAEMALDGRWDRSDDGFEDQIYNIDNAVAKAQLILPEVLGIPEED